MSNTLLTAARRVELAATGVPLATPQQRLLVQRILWCKPGDNLTAEKAERIINHHKANVQAMEERHHG